MPAPAKTFGKRNQPASPPANLKLAPVPPEPNSSFPPEAVLRRTEVLAGGHAAFEETNSGHGPRTVPNSKRAALLTGLVVACLHTSFEIGTSTTLSKDVMDHAGAISIGGHLLPLAPMILLESLWSGARWSIFGLFFVRAMLTPLKITHIAAYAFCGGGVALVYAALMDVLGLRDNVMAVATDVATGIAAGFFYRLFAGTRPAEPN